MKHAPSFADHMYRYAFAMRYCYKKDVLDAGSKEGFGAQMLSWVSQSITLADISGKWLQIAEKVGGYACPKAFAYINFERAFPRGEWDTIVAFEIIEHLAHPDVFLENVAKHLRPGGVLVFSVPHMLPADDHKQLFDEQKIKDLVEKYLDIKEFYVQNKEPYSKRPLYKNLTCYIGVAHKR